MQAAKICVELRGIEMDIFVADGEVPAIAFFIRAGALGPSRSVWESRFRRRRNKRLRRRGRRRELGHECEVERGRGRQWLGSRSKQQKGRLLGGKGDAGP